MRIFAVSLCLALAGCAAMGTEPPLTAPSLGNAQIDALRSALPGYYSDFSHRHETGDTQAVTEVTIRHLAADGDTAFLVSRRFREGEVDQHQLYQVSEADDEGVLVVRFAPLGAAQLDGSVPSILAAARERFRPGCELVLVATPDGLAGQTDPASCRFSHPRHGDVGLLRELSFGRSRLAIGERLLNAAGKPAGEDGILRLRKHRRFSGWAGVRVMPDALPDDPGAWRLAGTFGMSDDGRVQTLVDAAGDTLDYGLQLATVRWRADQPEILRLAVVNMGSGKIEAYAWTQPQADRVGINLDWFQAGLEVAAD
jgi:hypothetical protein